MSVLSVVVPAYNEEEGIASVVRRIADTADRLLEEEPRITDVEIVVVNDGSADRTEERARASPRVRVVNHPKNRGYGAALKTGFLQSRGDLIAFLDADGTYPPESLVALCAPVIAGQADMTVAARNRGGESGMPLLRRVGNSLFARLLTWIAETPVSDSASGMRVFRKSMLTRLLPLPDGLDFIVGLSTRALYESLRVQEIPVPYATREGSSKLSVVTDGFRFLRTFVMVGITYNPLKFFGACGLAALVLAALLGIGPVAYYVRVRRVEDSEIYRLFTILVLGVLGLQLVNCGIIGNRLLAMITGRPVETRSLFGRLLLNRGFSTASWRTGLVLCVGAVLLNHSTIVEYATVRSIDVHWSYIMTGATMFLVGAQLLMTGSLLTIFRMIADRQAYLKTPEIVAADLEPSGDQRTTERGREGTPGSAPG